MKTFPIFLLPKGGIMVTATIKEEEIIILKETLFPSNKRYTISETGLVACLDIEKKIITYGRIAEDGGMEAVVGIPFPRMISPKSICIIKNNFLLGGQKNNARLERDNSYELVATYSISQKIFTAVEMPFKEYGKSIDDLLVDNHRVLAVDNVIYPKYIIEYDCKNPDSPDLIKSNDLPNNGTNESIKKGTMNDKYIALLSSGYGGMGSAKYINIFRNGDFTKYIRHSQWFGISELGSSHKDDEKKYLWRDILLLADKDVLLISSDQDGIGIYFINDSKMARSRNEDSGSIKYFNTWNKKVIKILLSPISSDKIIIIFEELGKNNQLYSYSLESLEELLLQYNDPGNK